MLYRGHRASAAGRRKHQSSKKRLGVFLSMLLATAVCPVLAQPVNEDNALETALANAYFYLATRTTWPEKISSQSSFVFCVNRDQSLFEFFAKLFSSRKLQGLTIEQRSFEENDIETQRRCNLIALSTGESFNRKVIEHIQGLPILTISHEVDITRYGGLVYLAHEKRLEPPKIEFHSLESSHLKIDAVVLDLSRKRWGSD